MGTISTDRITRTGVYVLAVLLTAVNCYAVYQGGSMLRSKSPFLLGAFAVCLQLSVLFLEKHLVLESLGRPAPAYGPLRVGACLAVFLMPCVYFSALTGFDMIRGNVSSDTAAEASGQRWLQARASVARFVSEAARHRDAERSAIAKEQEKVQAAMNAAIGRGEIAGTMERTLLRAEAKRLDGLQAKFDEFPVLAVDPPASQAEQQRLIGEAEGAAQSLSASLGKRSGAPPALGPLPAVERVPEDTQGLLFYSLERRSGAAIAAVALGLGLELLPLLLLYSTIPFESRADYLRRRRSYWDDLRAAARESRPDQNGMRQLCCELVPLGRTARLEMSRSRASHTIEDYRTVLETLRESVAAALGRPLRFTKFENAIGEAIREREPLEKQLDGGPLRVYVEEVT